jgi:probable phosphoglycerate mutase
MTTLFCVRHGETDWNRQERWQGQDDQPLNALGRRQANDAARSLASDRFAAIYSSDLRRAVDTAMPLAVALELRPILDPGLREVDTGSWTGLTRDEVNVTEPDAVARYEAGGDGWSAGESFAAMFERVVERAAAIAAAHGARDRVAVFTHGGPIRSLVARAIDANWSAARVAVAPALHCSLTVIEIPPGGRWRLHAFNHPLVGAA